MNKRIEIIDVIRGLCIIYMVFYHFLYNLTAFSLVPLNFLYNPVISFMQALTAGTFIALCGVCSKFSRSNVKRGLLLCVISLAISLVTYIFDKNLFVVFGIIHFLAFSTLSYGLIQSKFEKLRLNLTFPISMLTAFLVFKNTISGTRFDIKGLSILGFTNVKFSSSDYFPILPWIFLFYLGVYLGGKIKENCFPSWFYTVKCDFLAYLGKKSLIIYVLHQPILVGITSGLAFLKGHL
ncbi:MAG: heparan-alpha-glucosaminide N-acetyltransferase [Clostridia bacterium]